MLSLHTNTAALSAHISLGHTQSRMAHAMTRLGTGLRVNSAMDDAAGLQIATRLSAQTHGMRSAMNNIQKSLSLLQTGEGALEESSNILIRMKDLAIQAADGSTTNTDRTALQAEYRALSQELSHISVNTTFGGARLLLGDTTVEKNAANAAAASAAGVAASAAGALAAAQARLGAAIAADQGGSTPATQAARAAAQGALTGATESSSVASQAATDAQQYASAVAAVTGIEGLFAQPVSFQIGSDAGETMSVDLSSQLSTMQTALHSAASTYDTFGIERPGAGTDVVVASAALGTIDRVQAAIDAIAGVRATLGATANRLTHTHNNLNNIATSTTLARGRIMDTDYAQESADMISDQMLMQAGGTVLRQTKSINSMLMSLLG
ncbi:MAG: flagellin [Sphingomonadaceae bacterium]